MGDLLGIEIGLWSLGISIIALVIAFSRDVIIPLIFKPRIVLEASNDDECINMGLSDTTTSSLIQQSLKRQLGGVKAEAYPAQAKQLVKNFQKRSRWLRVRIRNKDGFFSRTAVNCYVKLIEIKNGQGQKIGPFDAFPLLRAQYATPKNNLAKGEYHLLCLVHEYEDERVLYPTTWNDFCLSYELLAHKAERLGPGKYTLKLSVYGDNFNPVHQEIKVELSQQFGDLKFAD
jgi:hypothetical protein